MNIRGDKSFRLLQLSRQAMDLISAWCMNIIATKQVMTVVLATMDARRRNP